jgi:O-antigen/teichoic acid export membrane protein
MTDVVDEDLDPLGSAGLRHRLSVVLARGQVRSIGLLVGGTSLAHAITALAMPITTRLYTPHDFAVAAAFSSLFGILAVAACLRFDMAVPLPEDEVDGVNLLALSLGSTVGLALLTALCLLVLPDAAYAVLGQPDLVPHLWLLPIAVFIGGSFLAVQAWFVRNRGFGAIARCRIAQSTLAVGGQIGLGLLGRAPIGLLIGQTLNYGAASVLLGLNVLVRQREIWRRVTWSGMVAMFRTYQRFPRYSIWEALANAASINVPILMIAALAVGPEAGYLTLAIFLLQAPMTVLGNAIAQVFLSGAPEAHRNGQLAAYTGSNLVGLMRTAAPPLLFLMIVSPAAFGTVFGAPWARSGVLVSWMGPWFLMQFLASPISTALHVLGRQRAAMVLQMAGLIIRVAAVWATGAWWPERIAETYAVSGFVFYAVYLWVLLWAVRVKLSVLGAAALKALPLGLVAITSGGLLVLGLKSAGW